MSRAEVHIEELIYMDSHEYDSVKALMEIDRKNYSENNKLKEKYKTLLGHLDLVEYNCRKLAFKLIDEGQLELAHELIIEGRSHDLSKFYGDEWEYLCDFNKQIDDPKKKEAIKKHVTSNSHHPEFHYHRRGIHGMKDADLAALICDWQARGKEFNKPIRQFMEEKAFEKYGFSEESAVFQRMNYFYNLLTGENI